jgi:hypothetical protein
LDEAYVKVEWRESSGQDRVLLYAEKWKAAKWQISNLVQNTY